MRQNIEEVALFYKECALSFLQKIDIIPLIVGNTIID